MEELIKSYDSLLKFQEKFFEKLADQLRKDFYHIKKVTEYKCGIKFELDQLYEIRLDGVVLSIREESGEYYVSNLYDLYSYLRIKSTAIKMEDIDE